MVLKILMGGFLYVGFLMLFLWTSSESILHRIAYSTFDSLEAAARMREQEKRKTRIMRQERKGLLYRAEQRLVYSGLPAKIPGLTPEWWIAGNVAVCGCGYFVTLFVSRSWTAGILVMGVIQLAVYLTMNVMMSRNYRSVNDNLMKFLDFLGNYSITAGEVTGILNQISKYLDEPLRSALDECYYEAQTSGDAGLAFLTLSEKIEHPGFRELVRNMEISARYSADFSVLVRNSRRAVREQMRTRQERKGLVNEALVNMLILIGMSGVILMAVEMLTGTSVKKILLDTIPGRICLAVIAGIFILMYRQIRRLDQ